HVFDGVVVVDVGVAITVDVQVDQAVAGDLVQHVVQKRHAGIDGLAAGAVDVDGNADARLVGVAGNVGSTHDGIRMEVGSGAGCLGGRRRCGLRSWLDLSSGFEPVLRAARVRLQAFAVGQCGGDAPQGLGALARHLDKAAAFLEVVY